MTINADMEWLVSVLLLSVRLGAVFLLTPILAVTRAPVQFRVFFVLALSALLISTLNIVPAHVPTTLAGLIEAALYELLVGALMAFGLFTAFGAFLFGGRILDFQMGFGVANLIDPATNSQTAMMGVVLNMIAVMVFFSIDGHHVLLREITYITKVLPIGTLAADFDMAAVVAQFGAMFVFAVMIVAPALFGILLLDIALGVMARTMPQVNMFFVSIPLKVFIGLSLVALSLQSLSPLMEKIFESIFVFWREVLGS